MGEVSLARRAIQESAGMYGECAREHRHTYTCGTIGSKFVEEEMMVGDGDGGDRWL